MPTDINNLTSMEEPLEGFNPDAEMFSQPAPPPDGIYVVRLEQTPQYGSDEYWRQHLYKESDPKAGKPYYSTRIVGYIQDPTGRYDNRLVFGDFVSTGLFQNKETSTVAGIIRALGFAEQLGACQSHKDIASLFDMAVASGTPIRAKIRWQAQQWDKATQSNIVDVRGMSNFPELEPGVFQPFIEFAKDDESVGQAKARPTMIAYYPLGASASVAG